VLSQAVAEAEHASVETTQVGTGMIVEQPPEKFIVSVEATVVQPPPLVE